MAKLETFVFHNYVPAIQDEIKTRLAGVMSMEAENEISEIFHRCRTPFNNLSTEDKRLRYFKKKNWYRDPEEYEIGRCQVAKTTGQQSWLAEKPAKMIHASGKRSLIKLLEIDGLFRDLRSYMQTLYECEGIISNFIQGTVTKQMSINFPQILEFHNDCIQTLERGRIGNE